MQRPRPARSTPAAGRIAPDRQLRDVPLGAGAVLRSGQVLLASVGSTAPFVGLFGTVWGIYHALVGHVRGRLISLDRVTSPVGEALIMTAAGLAVAIPAVLAYNLFGKRSPVRGRSGGLGARPARDGAARLSAPAREA